MPRKELDAQGNEIDPHKELIDKILEYKNSKEAAVQMLRNGGYAYVNDAQEAIYKRIKAEIGEEAGRGTEIQTITVFKLLKHLKGNAKEIHTTIEQTGTYRCAL